MGYLNILEKLGIEAHWYNQLLFELIVEITSNWGKFKVTTEENREILKQLYETCKFKFSMCII